MKVARIALAAAAVTAIALPAGALPGDAALAASSATHTSAAHTSASHRQTVIVSCDNKWQVRPHFYLLACGDGSAYLARLRWSSWTPTEATATGRFLLNGCDPSCAQGKWYNSAVLVVLWKESAMPRHPRQREFLRMTVIYTGKRPSHTAQSFTELLWYPVVR